ncbi:ribonuclease P protein component [Allosalinactinospora lopnorensis]|uniref:ribonuclease P protein component n=1 Tax=Allosalinactinospora lopnorensis TaxID=1352348 RepID=UPI000623D289|nr:ribonuclease P protein component [Allosalinactinospora lopnorensis]
MLSPKNRMRRSADFGLVMRKGRRGSREALGVAYLAPPSGTGGESPGPPKVGFVVSKAVGGAVTRKRVQRRLRHLMRERLPLLPEGSLLVVRAKPLAASQEHDALAAQLEGALATAMSSRTKATRRPWGREADASNGARASGERTGS